MLKLFSITYEHGQQSPFIEYRNEAKDKPWRFEYNPMIDIVDNHLQDVEDNEFVGIFSHKFTLKTGIDKQRAIQILTKSKSDFVNFSPQFKYPIAGKFYSFMDWSADGHGETLRDLVKACCEHVGIEYNNDINNVVYANLFAAHKSVYVDYMNSVIKPSLELLEGKLWGLANKPANYSAGLETRLLKEKTGLEFYNYIPFVLERLTMQWNTTRMAYGHR
jgi:hypothetical protein